MGASEGEKTPSRGKKKSFFREFLARLRKRHIIETLAAFIGGGWLVMEVVHWLLVDHYHFPEKTIDLTFITILSALLCTLVWRWFRGTEKRPGNVKIEVLLIPLIILVTLSIDLNLILQIAGIPGKKLLVGIVAFLLGIAWIVFKSLQWAAISQNALPKDMLARPDSLNPFGETLSVSEMQPSIVVLPFENLSPDPENAFFTDGLTDELIAELSQIGGLRVISRTTSVKLKGSGKDVREISRELNIQYALEGSVRKAGDALRITAQLIDITRDTHLWADRYSGTVSDVFEFQERLARDIAQKLKVSLSPEEVRRIERRRIVDPVAYECYLRASQELTRNTEEAVDTAIVLLKKALQIEGSNELFIATLGGAYTRYFMLGLRPEGSLLREAETCADRVFEMNPNSPEGYALRGAIFFYRGQKQAAVTQLKKALLLNPKSSDALYYLVGIAGLSGHMEASRSYYARLSAINPWSGCNPGWVEVYSGRFEAALDGYRKEYEMDPQSPYGRWAYGSILAWAHHTNEACQILERLVMDAPNLTFGRFGALLLYSLQGKVDKALEAVTPDLIAAAKSDVQLSWMVGACYAMLGKAKDAIGWIEQAVERGFIHYPFLAEYYPFFANIRGEPRFKKLMERVKYEWEHFEV
jgi:TolB-like protein/lipoprotein NlpI